MFRRNFGWVIAAALVAACQSDGRAPDRGPTRARHHKPQAPVELRIETRPAGGTSYDVTLVATPTAAVKSLELALDGHVTRIGDSAAGQRRSVTTRVTLGQLRGREVVGSASVDLGSHRRRNAVVAQLGQPAAVIEPPVNIVRLPDGTEVAEVRP